MKTDIQIGVNFEIRAEGIVFYIDGMICKTFGWEELAKGTSGYLADLSGAIAEGDKKALYEVAENSREFSWLLLHEVDKAPTLDDLIEDEIIKRWDQQP